MNLIKNIKQDLKDFRDTYFPKTKIRRVIGAAKSFFVPDNNIEAEINALEFTIADLERQKRIIAAQISIMRWELNRKKWEQK